MGWWSAQCNDFTKVMIAAGRARQHHLLPIFEAAKVVKVKVNAKATRANVGKWILCILTLNAQRSY
jgi:hypothetical protein